MLETVENLRREVSESLDLETRSRLGQFLTPGSVAGFMASLFETRTGPARLLDAGAGIGALTTSLLDRFTSEVTAPTSVEVTAYEIDDRLRDHYKEVLAPYSRSIDNISVRVSKIDFIEDASNLLMFGRQGNFTHAILNPPYKKIKSISDHRFLLRTVGIETVNLYAAFVALSIKLLADGGQLVAIIPRSFCNGPYYRSFRDLILRETAIRRIHLFSARDKAFKDDKVLQENVILQLEKSGKQRAVNVSTSTDDTFDDLDVSLFDFDEIVFPGDRESFFHIPSSSVTAIPDLRRSFNSSLGDLLTEVSTGPVVDFRLKEYTSAMPQFGEVPLLYPAHFNGNEIDWPKSNFKKPNAIKRSVETEKWLFPSGFYTVVRRFSSKEERRRINASVVNPNYFSEFDALGFENHLNVFHYRRKGLDELLAYGLAAYLNSTAANNYFRRFNGHTQVNATDLRKMPYPDRDSLKKLGIWVKGYLNHDQVALDEKLSSIS